MPSGVLVGQDPDPVWGAPVVGGFRAAAAAGGSRLPSYHWRVCCIPREIVLNEADGRLAARWPGVPGLAAVLDPDRVAAVLGDSLGEGSLQRVERKTARLALDGTCVAAYRLEREGRVGWAYAKAWDEARPARDERGSIPLGPGAFVRRASDDPALRMSQALEDPLAATRLLRGFAAPPLDVRAEIDASEPLSVLSYKPERRAVLRLARPESAPLAVKLYRRRDFDRACGAARYVCDREELTVPCVVGISQIQRALAFGWVEGPSLRDRIAAGLATQDLRRTADGLAVLHAGPLDSLSERPLAQAGTRLRAAVEQVAVLAPAAAPWLDRAVRRVAEIWSVLPDDVVPTHGDFYAKQIVGEGESLVTLDWDGLAAGHPLTDVASFVAHLERDVCRGILDRANAEEARGAFLEAYALASGPIAPYALAAFESAALIRLAVQPFRVGDPSWPEGVDRIVDRALDVSGA